MPNFIYRFADRMRHGKSLVFDRLLGIVVLTLVFVSAIYSIIASSTASHSNKKSDEALRSIRVAIRELRTDEQCLSNWASELTAQTAQVRDLSQKLAAAERERVAALSTEQVIFKQAFESTSPNQKELRKEFSRAVNAYLRAKDRYERIYLLYRATLKTNPLPAPKLECKGHLVLRVPQQVEVPGPTTTETATVNATMHATTTSFREGPTIVLAGPTLIVTHHATATVTATQTHVRHVKATVTSTVTATKTCIPGLC